jgi:GTP cyclohydrolase II
VSAERWEDGIAAQILADLGVRNVRLLSTHEREQS